MTKLTIMVVLSSWIVAIAIYDVARAIRHTPAVSCPAAEAFEPPADPGLTAPGWDGATDQPALGC